MTPAHFIPTVLERTEYISALSFSKRRETYKPDGTVRQRAGCLNYLYRQTKHRIAIQLTDDCGCKTATWEWSDTVAGTPHHIIKVHPECPRSFFDDAKNNIKRRIDLTKSIITHEACHGLYTSRSKDLPRACRAAKVSFRLINLMEDCRIEHKYVLERGKEFKFRWRMFDDKMAEPGAKISSPTEWLYTMKTREPALFKTLSSVMSPYKWDGDSYVYHPTATSYPHPFKPLAGSEQRFVGFMQYCYTAIVSSPTTEDLIPIARYWTELFGAESDSSLPPIIINTVPSDIGGERSDDGDPSGADEASRDVDHTPVEPKAGVTGRASIEPDKVMHHNTDKWTQQPPRSGFIRLDKYLQK